MSRHAPLPMPSRPLPNRRLVSPPGRTAPPEARPIARALPAPSHPLLDLLAPLLSRLARLFG